MARIRFITYRQLVDDTTRLAGMLPPDISAVAGVPRSGMLPATILAQMFHVPLFAASAAGLIPIGHGNRLAASNLSAGRILVVDDSALSGCSLRSAVLALDLPPDRIVTAVVYAHRRHLRRSPELVRTYYRIISETRFFEWNLFNHPMTRRVMSDIDGVICRDPLSPDDDGNEYAAELVRALPFHLPRRRAIHTLITHRIERWREATVNWLALHGVLYRRLMMAPHPDAATRRLEMTPYGTWKAQAFKESRCIVFVESSKQQARRIGVLSGKPVICITNGAVYG